MKKFLMALIATIFTALTVNAADLASSGAQTQQETVTISNPNSENGLSLDEKLAAKRASVHAKMEAKLKELGIEPKDKVVAIENIVIEEVQTPPAEETVENVAEESTSAPEAVEEISVEMPVPAPEAVEEISVEMPVPAPEAVEEISVEMPVPAPEAVEENPQQINNISENSEAQIENTPSEENNFDDLTDILGE